MNKEKEIAVFITVKEFEILQQHIDKHFRAVGTPEEALEELADIYINDFNLKANINGDQLTAAIRAYAKQDGRIIRVASYSSRDPAIAMATGLYDAAYAKPSSIKDIESFAERSKYDIIVRKIK